MGKRSLAGVSITAIAAFSTIGSVANAQTVQEKPGATAAGQADAEQGGDIVVTARKRAERLRDVPIAASVIDAGDIEQRGGLQGVKDLVTTVPSLAFGDTSTPLTSEISIRGSGTSRGTSADSGVGLYRDGAFVGGGAQGGRTYSRFDLFDARLFAHVVKKSHPCRGHAPPVRSAFLQRRWTGLRGNGIRLRDCHVGHHLLPEWKQGEIGAACRARLKDGIGAGARRCQHGEHAKCDIPKCCRTHWPARMLFVRVSVRQGP